MNPANGRFTQQDSFAGYSTDPPSLHKYLYASAQPVSNIDPSGRMTLGQLTVATTVIGTLTGAGAGYYVGGPTGALIGGVAGGTAGYFAGINAIAIMFTASPLVQRMTTVVNTWATPAGQWLNGPTGRVSIGQLDRLSNSNMVTLYTNLSRNPEGTRSLSMASSQALAAAGGRANYATYVFRIPSGVVTELERVGLLRLSRTSEAGIQALEYEFLMPGTAYIMKFLEVVR